MEEKVKSPYSDYICHGFWLLIQEVPAPSAGCKHATALPYFGTYICLKGPTNAGLVLAISVTFCQGFILSSTHGARKAAQEPEAMKATAR